MLTRFPEHRGARRPGELMLTRIASTGVLADRES